MKALIVDDELGNRSLLSSMLRKHCPEVTVVGDAESADAAFALINELKPDLVFLDIKMPDKSGFDLLRMFHHIDFAVIFVTGFDEYAIKAFEFNAIDYLLKPLDYTKLITAVKKAGLQTQPGVGKIIQFVHTLEEKTNYIKKLTLHSKDKVHVLDLNDVIYIMADRNYCQILDVRQQKHISAKPLADYEILLENFMNFIRVNKSYIININHLDSYTKGNECVILMKGSKTEIEVSRRKKTEVILSLKEKL